MEIKNTFEPTNEVGLIYQEQDFFVVEDLL